MTTGTATDTANSHGDDFVQAWEAIRSDDTIQYAPVEMPEAEPTPEWVQTVADFLEWLFSPLASALGSSWPVMKWVLLGIAILALVWLLWRLLAPTLRIRNSDAEIAEAEWAPDQSHAIALLEEADHLAADGRYDEATHLLLQRSVGHIAASRPDWLEPSSTAREIALLPALPDSARTAFSTIAERVERSLFALRPLNADDWQAARTAYSDFALAPLGIPS